MVSMVFVVIVAGMGVVMVQMHTGQTRRLERAIDNKRALYIAEAGIAEGFLAVAEGKSGNIASETEPARFGDGVFWVEAEDVGGGLVALTSNGLCGKGRFSLNATLKRSFDPVASLGVYSVDGMVVGEGVIADGYFSTRGTFADQIDADLGADSTGEGALLASGADITLTGAEVGSRPRRRGRGGVGASTAGSTVYGSCRPGPEGAVSVGTGVSVTGSTSPSAADAALPGISLPDLDATQEATFRGLSATMPPGEHGFSKVELPSKMQLTLQGPATYLLGELVIPDSAELIVDSTGGQVTIFVESHLRVEAGGKLTTVTADPAGLVLMVAADEWQDFDGDSIADPPVEFFPSGDFHGFVYAPESDITIESSTRFFGGIVARTVTLGDEVHITFDRSLVDSEIVAAGLPLLVAWRVKDLPAVPIVQQHKDPLDYLSEQGVTPKESGQAHKDEFLEIQYYDTGGKLTTYSGDVASFDWNEVETVTGVVWDDDPVIGDEGQVKSVPLSLSGKEPLYREKSGKGRKGWGKGRKGWGKGRKGWGKGRKRSGKHGGTLRKR